MQYKVISEDYISNCLIEAIRAKARNNQVKIYFCSPRITENGHFQMLHAMWEDENGSYDFSEPEAVGLPLWRQLLFRGHIRQFERDFAERYTAYRNGRN